MALSVFFFYKLSAERLRLKTLVEKSDASSYCLYGAPELAGKGWIVADNLDSEQELRGCCRSLVSHIDHYLHSWGRLWGDLGTVLAYRRSANEMDVVIATADNVGIPLSFLKMMGLIRPPVIYISIGLPEKIANIRSRFWAFLCRKALRSTAQVLAYGYEETARLGRWLNDEKSSVPVDFLPFGVDAEYFSPSLGRLAEQTDVLSIGADVQRDYDLLLCYAADHPSIRITIVTSRKMAETLSAKPANVDLVCDVPFSSIRDLLAGACIVALPVKENSYSGATTTLLQAMAMGNPVVISSVGAIRDGYGLKDGENCSFVKPGDAADFRRAIDRLLADGNTRAKLGQNARSRVIQELSWNHYVDRLISFMRESVGVVE